MWARVVTYKLPMGDEFIVQRKPGAPRGSGWRGLIRKKNGDIRVCCSPARLKAYVDEYYKIACLCQRECLEGLNPYVSKEYACTYRDQV